MRVEYDFDQMAGGVRGKYAAAWEGRTPAMSFTDLQRKIAGGESATLEFKKSTVADSPPDRKSTRLNSSH